jgi:acetyltransferase-like isoleucine patch superfamily enzyme
VKLGTKFFQHANAIVDSKRIGEGTRVWAFAQVMNGAVIGKDCNIGGHAFIESGAKIGNGVTVKNGVAVWEGVTVDDFAFLGPNCVFTNDLRPRSPRFPGGKIRYQTKAWVSKTKVGKGASIGANATIVCGVKIGAFAMIGAGAVVTKDVPAHTLMLGVPAKPAGFVCECGEALEFANGKCKCAVCGTRYTERRGRVSRAKSTCPRRPPHARSESLRVRWPSTKPRRSFASLIG